MLVAALSCELHPFRSYRHRFLGATHGSQAARLDPRQRRALRHDHHAIELTTLLLQHPPRLVVATELAKQLGAQPVSPEPPQHIRRSLGEQTVDGSLGAVELRGVGFQTRKSPLPRREQQSVGDVGQLPRGSLVVAELLSDRQRNPHQLGSALVVQERVAVDAEAVCDVGPQPAARDPIQGQDALGRQVRRERELTQTGGVCRREACRVNGGLAVAGLLEQRHRPPGVRDHVSGAPLV